MSQSEQPKTTPAAPPAPLEATLKSEHYFELRSPSGKIIAKLYPAKGLLEIRDRHEWFYKDIRSLMSGSWPDSVSELTHIKRQSV